MTRERRKIGNHAAGKLLASFKQRKSVCRDDGHGSITTGPLDSKTLHLYIYIYICVSEKERRRGREGETVGEREKPLKRLKEERR